MQNLVEANPQFRGVPRFQSKIERKHQINSVLDVLNLALFHVPRQQRLIRFDRIGGSDVRNQKGKIFERFEAVGLRRFDQAVVDGAGASILRRVSRWPGIATSGADSCRRTARALDHAATTSRASHAGNCAVVLAAFLRKLPFFARRLLLATLFQLSS